MLKRCEGEFPLKSLRENNPNDFLPQWFPHFLKSSSFGKFFAVIIQSFKKFQNIPSKSFKKLLNFCS